MDVFVLTYIGLSDNDPDGNGYCDVEVFDEHQKALDKMEQWLQNELEEQKDNNPRVERYIEQPDEVAIWWSGDNEGVRMKMFRKHIN